MWRPSSRVTGVDDQDRARKDRAGRTNPHHATALAAVVSLRRLACRLELAAVAEAISQGWRWAQVGEELGVTAQAAHTKFAAEVRARRGS